MPIIVTVTASFQAEDQQEAEKAVKKMKFPSGAQVSTHLSQMVESMTGVADDSGAVQPNPAPEPVEEAS